MNNPFSSYYDYLNTFTAQQHNKITTHHTSAQAFLFSFHLPKNRDPSYILGATVCFESFCGKWKQKILLKSPYVSEYCLCPLNEAWESRSPLGHHLNVCLYSETILQRNPLVALSSVGCQMTMTTGFLEVELLGHSFTEDSRFRNALLRDLKKGLLVIWSL